MRIKLKEGKQTQLILLAKGKDSWKDLAKKISVAEGYLKNDLRKERVLLSEEIYKKSCSLLNRNFDEFVIKRLEDNWGRAKGGSISKKRIKPIKIPKIDENLAEIIGIILGDGHVSEFIKGKKIRNYFIRIAANTDPDKDYLENYIPRLFTKVFKERGKIFVAKDRHVGYYTIYGKGYVDFFKSIGLGIGNKKSNNQGIPFWIKKDKKLLKRCLKGLIDTDGSVHTISKKNLRIRIDYTGYIPKLMEDVRNGFIFLGFSPSKIINKKHFFLSRQEEVKKYVKEIGFGNSKNLNRFRHFEKNAPVVQRPRIRPSQT